MYEFRTNDKVTRWDKNPLVKLWPLKYPDIWEK